MEQDRMEFVVSAGEAGQRLNVFLGDSLPLDAESFLRHLVASGKVSVDGSPCNGRRTLRQGDTVIVAGLCSERRESHVRIVPVDVLYEDDHILALNKPAGCTAVRKRNAGACTFQDGILEYLRRSKTTFEAAMRARYRPRAIHRLDYDTSGAIIEAKTRAGELHLARQFQDRTIGKEYLAVVHGESLEDSGTIDAPIAAVPHDLARMRISEKSGKPSSTQYEVIERFKGFALVRAQPQTGRRHQIRIHFAHAGHPIVADETYGGGRELMLSSIKSRYRIRRGEAEKPLIARQALHANALTFLPVASPERLRVEAPPPRDFELLLKMLRKYARRS